MFLRITSPDKVVFEGKILKMTIPTEMGTIGVLPGHAPLSSVVKPGIAKITIDISEKEQFIKKAKYLFDEEDIVISISKGLLFVDGHNILIVTSDAATSPQESQEIIEKNKQELEKQIQELRIKGNIEELETALVHLQKVEADLKLFKYKGIIK